MSNPVVITFIICTYNRSGYLKETLESLLEGNLPGQPVEILVVDNNSEDETADIVKQCAGYEKPNITIRYVKEKKQGLSHARNKGIKDATASIIIFVDDDIRAADDFINSWIQFFEDYPEAVAAGGKIYVQFDAPCPRWMSHFLLPLLGHHDFGNMVKRYRKSKYPFGGNMAFKKEIFDQYGYFNTSLGRKGKSLNAGEEKELFSRLNARDVEIFYLPDALLYHRVGAERLTVDYIKKQALGLGESMYLRLTDVSFPQQVSTWAVEMGKLIISFPLSLYYLFKMEPSKALMLYQFRMWIWMGYFGNRFR